MDRYRAVFFDWRGTLAHLPEPEWWVGRALESIGRPVAPQVVQAAVAGLDAAAELPEVLEAERHEDCSWELHRSVTMRRFELAGLDSELAEALYRLDLDPASHPLYPDVPEVLVALRARGVRVADGPFVINTREELLQAFEDDQAGRLGTIPAEPRPGHEILKETTEPR